MKKPVKATTEVRETAVGILSEKQEDYICLTDIARYKDPERTDYLIKEFQRLKDDENRRLSLAWNLNRTLSKLNYRIHTDAIKSNLIPPATRLIKLNAI